MTDFERYEHFIELEHEKDMFRSHSRQLGLLGMIAGSFMSYSIGVCDVRAALASLGFCGLTKATQRETRRAYEDAQRRQDELINGVNLY